jgi:hypothetical protein
MAKRLSGDRNRRANDSTSLRNGDADPIVHSIGMCSSAHALVSSCESRRRSLSTVVPPRRICSRLARRRRRPLLARGAEGPPGPEGPEDPDGVVRSLERRRSCSHARMASRSIPIASAPLGPWAPDPDPDPVRAAGGGMKESTSATPVTRSGRSMAWRKATRPPKL